MVIYNMILLIQIPNHKINCFCISLQACCILKLRSNGCNGVDPSIVYSRASFSMILILQMQNINLWIFNWKIYHFNSYIGSSSSRSLSKSAIRPSCRSISGSMVGSSSGRSLSRRLIGSSSIRSFPSRSSFHRSLSS